MAHGAHILARTQSRYAMAMVMAMAMSYSTVNARARQDSKPCMPRTAAVGNGVQVVQVPNEAHHSCVRPAMLMFAAP